MGTWPTPWERDGDGCRLSELYVAFRIEKQRGIKRPKVEITQ